MKIHASSLICSKGNESLISFSNWLLTCVLKKTEIIVAWPAIWPNKKSQIIFIKEAVLHRGATNNRIIVVIKKLRVFQPPVFLKMSHLLIFWQGKILHLMNLTQKPAGALPVFWWNDYDSLGRSFVPGRRFFRLVNVGYSSWVECYTCCCNINSYIDNIKHCKGVEI